jgi:hypothetical protein
MFMSESTNEGEAVVSFMVGREKSRWMFIHTTSLPTSAGLPEYPVATARRLVCHALMNELPDAALPELFEALTGMYEFYSAREQGSRRSLPEPDKPIAAQVIQTVERAPFSLAEE